MTFSGPAVHARALSLGPGQVFTSPPRLGTECVIVLEGDAVLRAAAGEIPVRANTVVVHADCNAWELIAREPATVVVVQWSPDALQRLGALAAGVSANLVLQGRSTPALAWRLKAELRRADEFSGEAVELFARAIALSLSRFGRRRRVREWRVARQARALIESSSPETAAIAELANALGVTPAYLSRVFRATYGESPSAFGRRLRVERARTLLTSTTLTVARIAHDLGYADASHFARDFVRAAEVSPAAYRRQHENPEGQARTKRD